MKRIISLAVATILAAVLFIPFISYGTDEDFTNAIVLYLGSENALVNNELVNVDENTNVVPFLDSSNRTLVPIRFISESLNAKVNWDEKTETITITKDDKTIKFVIGQKMININGVKTEIDTQAVLRQERTFVPLRAVSAAFDKEVFYDRGLIIVSEVKDIFDPLADKEKIDNMIAKVNFIPTVGSFENLKTIAEASGYSGYYYSTGGSVASTGGRANFTDDGGRDGIAPSAPMPTPSPTPQDDMQIEETTAAKGESDDADGDFSKTNTQVQGVDEADVVKTDGEYIYHISNNNLFITRAYPSDNLEKVSEIKFSEQNFYPTEMYVDKNDLIVVGRANLMREYKPYSNDKTTDEVVKETTVPSGGAGAITPYVYPNRAINMVRTIVFDIEDRANPKKIREVDIEGSYLSSRKVGANVYIASNKYFDYYGFRTYMDIEPAAGETTEVSPKPDDDVDFLPAYADGGVVSCIYPENIKYFPNSEDLNYLNIGSFNLDKPEQKVHVESYMGAGDNIYVSNAHMFVAKSQGDETKVYKFSLGNGKTTFLAKGTVKGEILNQFSMDEFGGYFRIATTTDKWSSSSSKNNVYVVNDAMEVCGSIEDIAPGERIYSTRFMGEKLYMVTFRKVDPLFVISLKDPTKPEILGKLKIPGYSDYLHPYDENHIIGFGKDAEEYGSGAYYQGMKMAIFDVSDVNDPKEMFVEHIGDRGTESELLHNHKALLFSREKNLLAFPVTIMRKAEGSTSVTEYGQFEFQGALVYNIDLENGFKLRGRMTHMSDEDYKKAGSYYSDYNKEIKRILYIGDVLYGISNGSISANRMDNAQLIKKIDFLD